MTSRAGMVIIALVVLGFAGWRMARDSDDAAPPRVTPAPAAPVAAPEITRVLPTVSGAPHSAATVTPAPALPEIVPASPPKPPPEAFTAETRDDRWARPTEADLQHRAATLEHVRVDGIECRAQTCKLAFAGDPSAVSSAIDALGAALHLRITISGSAIHDTGGATVTAYIAYPSRDDVDADR